MQKVLIIQTNSASHLLLDTALFRCMKTQWPQVEIHLVVDEAFVHLVQHNRNLSQIFSYHNNLKALQADFHLHGYDTIVDLQNDYVSQQMIAGLDAEHYYAKPRGFLTRLFSGFKSHLARIDYIFGIVKDLKVQYDEKGPDFRFPAEEGIQATDIPTSHAAGYICILLNKTLDADALKIVCERINHPIILLGTKADQAAGEEIAATDSVKIYNAAGKFSFNETADLIRKSKLLVAEPNEYLYIAINYNLPSVVLARHKKELQDVKRAYVSALKTNLKPPAFLYDSGFIQRQKTTELSDKIQQMLLSR